MTMLYVSALFALLAVVFGGLAYRDYGKGGGPNPAFQARRRIAVIFAIVSVGLFVLQRFVA
ncbi:MAG: hypothetical protein OEU56_02870 [Rhodospirillales bacterium]|nr:hypothetical protein [Rhodospirillales bacterium]